MTAQHEGTQRARRLATMVAQDPMNDRLAEEAINAALDAGETTDARQTIAQIAALRPLPPGLAHLAGVAAMRAGDWQGAVTYLRPLAASSGGAPQTRFNLAWSLAMLGEHRAAREALDRETIETLPQAAALTVQLLHHQADLEGAARLAEEAIARFPDHAPLNAAVSTLAVDLDNLLLAEQCARRAGDHPEALVTIATLALGDDQPGRAAAAFDDALARDPTLPRAWIGRGLTRLLSGDQAGAAQDIDRGAEQFSTHLGSWIAAGWAHLLAGSAAIARARFDRAMSLDENFAECHGSLAVLDVLDGHAADARRRMAIALRLDRASFSAALAGLLLASARGDQATATAIMQQALAAPIGDSGRTIAQSMARLGLSGR